jgi:hypothetical protein
MEEKETKTITTVLPVFKMEIAQHGGVPIDEFGVEEQLFKARLEYKGHAVRVRPPTNLQLRHRLRDVHNDGCAGNPLLKVNVQPPKSRQIDKKRPFFKHVLRPSFWLAQADGEVFQQDRAPSVHVAVEEARVKTNPRIDFQRDEVPKSAGDQRMPECVVAIAGDVIQDVEAP